VRYLRTSACPGFFSRIAGEGLQSRLSFSRVCVVWRAKNPGPRLHRFAEILRRGIPTAQNDERGVGLVADHPGATIHPIAVQASSRLRMKIAPELRCDRAASRDEVTIRLPNITSGTISSL